MIITIIAILIYSFLLYYFLNENLKLSQKKAITIVITVFVVLFSSYIIFKNYSDNERSVQLALNKKVATEHFEFNIIKNDAIFSDQYSKLIFSELTKSDIVPFSFNFDEQTKILINNLYQSTITNKFFWYSFAVINSMVVDEQIVAVEEDTVKEFLLKTDKVIYIKIFGEPNPY